MNHRIVLLATADHVFAEIATDAIIDTRHGVRRANDLPETERLLGENTWDLALAIVDLDLADTEGFHALHDGPLAFPVLAVTGNVETYYRHAADSRSIADYLIKPVALDELRQKVRELSVLTECDEVSRLLTM
ncbi:hypothetical protein BH09VER1_BH09VER1_03480 [soil metagenome]